MNQLLAEGLAITVIGMGLVFGVLGLLWGLLALLTRIFPGRIEAPPNTPSGRTAEMDAARGAAAALTAERAQVAALAAAALMANALPMLVEQPSPGPKFEHGRSAPSWVSGNRARTLHPWQPSRRRTNND